MVRPVVCKATTVCLAQNRWIVPSSTSCGIARLCSTVCQHLLPTCYQLHPNTGPELKFRKRLGCTYPVYGFVLRVEFSRLENVARDEMPAGVFASRLLGRS
jgi:hypothetical protein